jgi:hypothetical protein
MSRVQVSYIGVCYAMLIGLLTIILLWTCFFPKGQLLTIAVLGLICLSLTAIAIGFLRRHRWAWYATWIVGALAVILGGWIFWRTITGSQYRDSGEAWPIGIVILGFALGALWNMATSELDKFVLNEEA